MSDKLTDYISKRLDTAETNISSQNNMLNEIKISISKLEGKIDTFLITQLQKIEKDIEYIEKDVDDIKNWKNKIIWVGGIISATAGFLSSVILPTIFKIFM